MSPLLLKIIGISGIVLGEILSIFAENRAVQIYHASGLFSSAFFKMLPIITVGGALLIGGYLLTVAAFRDVWIAALVSIIGILVVEPFVVYTFFHEMPSRGEFAGLIFAALGLLATVAL